MFKHKFPTIFRSKTNNDFFNKYSQDGLTLRTAKLIDVYYRRLFKRNIPVPIGVCKS